MSEPQLVWLRRDLRVSDHPALSLAASQGPVQVLFVLDPDFFDGAGPVRQGWLAANLIALRTKLNGRLCLRWGKAVEVVPMVAAEIGAREVHLSAETEPAGQARDRAVAQALATAGIGWTETGSPYAVTPARVRTREDGGFKVFSAFQRAWNEQGWRGPASPPGDRRAMLDRPRGRRPCCQR